LWGIRLDAEAAFCQELFETGGIGRVAASNTVIVDLAQVESAAKAPLLELDVLLLAASNLLARREEIPTNTNHPAQAGIPLVLRKLLEWSRIRGELVSETLEPRLGTGGNSGASALSVLRLLDHENDLSRPGGDVLGDIHDDPVILWNYDPQTAFHDHLVLLRHKARSVSASLMLTRRIILPRLGNPP
jgi:hypothetical protein